MKNFGFHSEWDDQSHREVYPRAGMNMRLCGDDLGKGWKAGMSTIMEPAVTVPGEMVVEKMVRPCQLLTGNTDRLNAGSWRKRGVTDASKGDCTGSDAVQP